MYYTNTDVSNAMFHDSKVLECLIRILCEKKEHSTPYFGGILVQGIWIALLGILSFVRIWLPELGG